MDYWDRMLEVERQLVGPHFPNITSSLLHKWAAIGRTITGRTPKHVHKKWKDMAKEVENELLITHGEEHPEYSYMMQILNQIL